MTALVIAGVWDPQIWLSHRLETVTLWLQEQSWVSKALDTNRQFFFSLLYFHSHTFVSYIGFHTSAFSTCLLLLYFYFKRLVLAHKTCRSTFVTITVSTLLTKSWVENEMLTLAFQNWPKGSSHAMYITLILPFVRPKPCSKITSPSSSAKSLSPCSRTSKARKLRITDAGGWSVFTARGYNGNTAIAEILPSGWPSL